MKGYTIDCNYLIQVKEYQYPRPTPKTRSVEWDDETLPIISIEAPV